MHEGKNVNGEIKDYGDIICMRAKIKCETENQGLRRKRGTRAKEESKRLRERIKGAENA